MIPNAYRIFNFDLGETADAIRETVHSFSSNEIAPRAAEIDRTNQFPRDLWPKIGALGLHGITVEEEYGGGRGGCLEDSAPLRGDVGASASPGVALRRPVLRPPFQPLYHPAPPQRQRGAEAQISAQADLRRARRLARD